MPRPHKLKMACSPPECSLYRPAGVPIRMKDVIEVGLDEMEAVRLADIEGLYQEDAAERMGTSRPTFTRLLESGRGKLARAVYEARPLRIQGGNVEYCHERVFECGGCGKGFSEPFGTGRPSACPKCGSSAFRRVDKCPCGARRCGRRGSER